MSVGFLSLQFPDLGLSGAVILSQAAHAQVDINFPGRFDRQLVWVEVLLYKGIEMKLRASITVPAQGEDAGRPASHMQRTGKLSSRDSTGS